MSCKEINHRKAWIGIVLLPICSVLSVGCAIPHVPSRIVYEDPVNYVRLEEDAEVLPEWPPGHHAHPITIAPEKVREILSGLKVQEHRTWPQQWMQGEAPLVPAFTDEELALLFGRISEALAEAKQRTSDLYLASRRHSPGELSRRVDSTFMGRNCTLF